MAPLTLTFRARPGARVQLAGDFPTWWRPLPLAETAEGEYRATLDLAPGLYRYQLLVDGRRYVTDPHAPARDRAEGFDNGLLIVGGASPPLYFAPDRRHLARYDDGELVVHGEVDEGAPLPRAVSVDRQTSLPVVEGVRRGGRVTFTARGHVGARARALRFDGAGPSFELPAPSPRAPAWLDGAVLYGVFIDRWHRGRSSAPDPRASPASAPSSCEVFYGGDLAGVSESLEEIQALGATAIALTPVHSSPTPHRYDALDLLTVDERLGGEAALEGLVERAHALGLLVVADLSVTHVSAGHPAFVDVLARQERSPFFSWFRVLSLPVREHDPATYLWFYDRPDLPLLDLDDEGARAHAIEAALSLVRAGVDGLRLDAMDDAPASFWRELRRAVLFERAGVALLGEVVSDRPARYMGEGGLDCATDFAHRNAMLAFFADDEIDAAELVSRLAFQAHRRGALEPSARLLFLDNHDTPRFLSRARGDVRRLWLALAYTLFQPEPVWLTYATEAELASDVAGHERLDDAWPDRLPMPRDSSTSTRAWMRALCALRPQLCGEARVAVARGRLVVLERGGVQLALSTSAQPVESPFPSSARVLLDSAGATSASAPLAPLGARIARL